MLRTPVPTDSAPRRRLAVRRAAAVALAVVSTLIGSVVVSSPSQAATRPSDETVIQQILTDTNKIRADNGLGPLRRNSAIDTVARNWSVQQAANNAMSHNPNFSTQIPSGWSRAGENVAYGYDPSGTSNGYIAVVDAWKNSPGHLANILGDYTDIGIGIAYATNGYPYYTQNFGKYGASVPPIANSLPADTPPPSTDPTAPTPIYRFWSPANQTHFYTASAQERDAIVRIYPSRVWRYEGVAYYAFSEQRPGTVPVYRFWSSTQSGHFYTISDTEKNTMLAIYPSSVWSYDGIAFYVYPTDTQVTGTTPVYRFWSPSQRHHFFTSSAYERDVITTTYSPSVWTYEGEAFRVPTVG